MGHTVLAKYSNTENDNAPRIQLYTIQGVSSTTTLDLPFNVYCILYGTFQLSTSNPSDHSTGNLFRGQRISIERIRSGSSYKYVRHELSSDGSQLTIIAEAASSATTVLLIG